MIKFFSILVLYVAPTIIVLPLHAKSNVFKTLKNAAESAAKETETIGKAVGDAFSTEDQSSTSKAQQKNKAGVAAI